MFRTTIAYIEIRFFIHATEDQHKVLEAVRQILPKEYVGDIKFKRSNLKGHYGNPIILLNTRIRDRKIIKSFIENLSEHLHHLDKEVMGKKINLHVEKGSMYLRLDKQSGFKGEVKPCTIDPIRIRIRFKKKKLEDIIETCRELGILI